MKPGLLVWSIVFVLAAGMLQGCTTGQAPNAASGGTSAAQAPQENVIWASGNLVPARWATLSPAAGGTVKAVLVSEGDWVEAGALLAEINTDIVQRQIESAAAAVAEAQAAAAVASAPATPADLAMAQAEVTAAQAAISRAQAGVAQIQGASAAAEAQVAIAQAQYDEMASRPTAAERAQAQKQVELARQVMEQAQAAYDRVRGDPNIAMRPEALALQQATTSYEAAKAAGDAILLGATREQLAVARSQVAAAQAQAQATRSQAPAAEADVQAAQAQRARSQAALDRLKAGVTAENRALAESRVKSAQAGLALAQAQLAQTRITAPFAGVVGSVSVHLGELASPGQTIIVLGDTGQMRVETTDLRETDVTRLKIGMAVEVTFDALPGRTFQGKVTRIAPMSSAEKGSVNYTVTVEVADLDSSLRWGMTAFVNIGIGK